MSAISAPPGTGSASSVVLDIAAPLPLASDRSALRPGETDKTVMGASRTGSYQVTPPGRARAGDATARNRPVLAKTANSASVDGGSHPGRRRRPHRPSHCRRDGTGRPGHLPGEAVGDREVFNRVP